MKKRVYQFIILTSIFPIAFCAYLSIFALWLHEFIERTVPESRPALFYVRIAINVEHWLRRTFGEVEGPC